MTATGDPRFQLAVDAASNAVLVVDDRGTILHANLQVASLLGYDQAALVGLPVEHLVPRRVRAAHPALRAAFHANPSARKVAPHRTVHAVRRDGTEVPVELSLHPVGTREGSVVLVSVADVSERLRLEDALRSAEDRLTLSLAGSPDGVWDWDIPTGDVFYSARFTGLLGCQPDEFGTGIDALHEHVHPDDRRTVLEAIGAHLSQRWQFDCEMRLQTRTQGYRWFRARGQAVWNEAGTPVRMAGTISDITAHRNAQEDLRDLAGRLQASREAEEQQAAEIATLTGELRAAHDEALAAARAKSALVATMSHEIRTPLNGVIGGLDLALSGEMAPGLRDLVDIARASADQLLASVNDIIDFARLECGSLRLVSDDFSLATILEHAAAEVRGTDARAVSVRWRVDEDTPPWLRGDGHRLHQLLLTLLRALVRATPVTRFDVRAKTSTDPGGRLRLRVTVHCPTLTASTLEQLFERQTVLEVVAPDGPRGLDLTMAIFWRLVRAMQGGAGVWTDSGAAACWFDVLVGVGQGIAAPRVDVVDESRVTLPNDVRVLIVDDDDVNRTVLGRLVERTGATVAVARDGSEAVQAMAEAGYDLVLMDHYMPGLDGPEATRRIRAAETRAGHRAIIVGVTASVLDDDRRLCEAAGMDDFVSKPVSAQVLHSVLRRWVKRVA